LESGPVAFRDLPLECYPFTIEFFNVFGVVVHTIGPVEGPAAIRIPPLGQTHGTVTCRITYATGEVVEG
jgi:hypothetical protein